MPYPTACSPQAWATGAPFVFIKVMLGLDVADGKVTIDPHVPEDIGRVYVHGAHAFGTHWDVEATGSKGNVRLTANSEATERSPSRGTRRAARLAAPGRAGPR